MSSPYSSDQIVTQMMEQDAFSRWLGIERLEDAPGYAKVQLVVRSEMLNGFGIAHGGITFSLADSAFAFASNSRGRQAVSIETAINHLAPVFEGDILTAIAREQHLSNRLGHYQVEVYNQKEEKVGLFKGVVYRKEREWGVVQ